jgi:glycosyltransferase involved in cell wall biosynthesis
MDNPDVPDALSVIIPTYNRAQLVGRAIDSVLASISPGDEIIVADDGSTDDTAAVVESYGPPVRLLKLEHGGVGAARNQGLAAAKGPFIAFLDSDDEWFPDKVALQRTFLERRPDVLFAFTDFGVRLEDGSEQLGYLYNWMMPPRPYEKVFGPGVPYSSIAPLPPARADFDVHVLSMYLEEMRNSLITAWTFMGRKDSDPSALRFAEDLATAEDWEALGRYSGRGLAAFFATETAWQHGHSGERLSQAKRHVLADAWLTLLERVWGQDEEFLRVHGREYRRTRSAAQAMKATSLVRHGKLRDAGRAAYLAGAVAIFAKVPELLSELIGHASS